MIILSKDKIDERFNIDDDGLITDLQGNLQETYLHNGRATFKGVGVHKIQMYTKNGYQDLVIHHIDENKLNNNINNLQYLTNQEHVSLHKKGEHHSEETKKKLSAAMKGKNNPMYGKHWKINPETGKRIYY